jgi:hypothetical protein
MPRNCTNPSPTSLPLMWTPALSRFPASAPALQLYHREVRMMVAWFPSQRQLFEEMGCRPELLAVDAPSATPTCWPWYKKRSTMRSIRGWRTLIVWRSPTPSPPPLHPRPLFPNQPSRQQPHACHLFDKMQKRQIPFVHFQAMNQLSANLNLFLHGMHLMWSPRYVYVSCGLLMSCYVMLVLSIS